MERVTTLIAHAVASGVVAVVTLAVATVGFLGLLLWAVLAGEPIGGPLALVGVLLTAIAFVPIMLLLFLMPATATARWLRRAFRWSWWVEMPLATIAMVLYVAIVFFALSYTDTVEQSREGAGVAGAFAGTLLLPLGLYWWSFTAADGVLRLVRAGWTYLVRAMNTRRQAGA
jgi:hypothetical protein